MVTNLNDSVNYAAGDGSLRGEMAAARSGDTIQFASNLAGTTITLTAGELVINESISIIGLTSGAENTGKPTVTISGNNNSRVFDIEGGNTGSGISVTLEDLNITKGVATNGGGGGVLINDPQGGTVTLNRLVIFGNEALGNNGATGAVDRAGQSGTAASGGGVSFVGGSNTYLVMDVTLISGNTAAGGQGGLGGHGGQYGSFGGGSGTIRAAGGSGGSGGSAQGGGLFAAGGNIQLTSVDILNNDAVGGTGGSGGTGGTNYNYDDGPGGDGGAGGNASGGGAYIVNSNSFQYNGVAINNNEAEAGSGGAGGVGGNHGAGITAAGNGAQGGSAAGRICRLPTPFLAK
jgi:hypothetical protein